MKEHKINNIDQGFEIINRIAHPHRFPYERTTIRFGKPYAPVDCNGEYASIKSFRVPEEYRMEEYDTIYIPIERLRKLIQEVLYDGDDVDEACRHHLKMTYHPEYVRMTKEDILRLECEIKRRCGC